MSSSGSTNILSMWSIFHYNFRLQDYHIFSLKQTIVFSTFYLLPVKGSASGCCLVFTYFLGKFSLVLLIKMYLLKESIYFTQSCPGFENPSALDFSRILYSLFHQAKSKKHCLIFYHETVSLSCKAVELLACRAPIRSISHKALYYCCAKQTRKVK